MKDNTSRWFPLCRKRLFPDASETPGEALCVHHSIEARGQRGNGSSGVACVQRLGDDDVYVGFLIYIFVTSSPGSTLAGGRFSLCPGCVN